MSWISMKFKVFKLSKNICNLIECRNSNEIQVPKKAISGVLTFGTGKHSRSSYNH